jgi:hypothetical protein
MLSRRLWGSINEGAIRPPLTLSTRPLGYGDFEEDII